MNILKRFKQKIVELVQRHPYSYFYTKILVNRLPFLLPHEESFFAFRRLAHEKQGLFLDVGANDGISALSFRKMNKSYSIVSIEANPYHERNLSRLGRTLRNFSYHLVGASNERAELDLYVPFYKRIPLHSASTFQLDADRENFNKQFSPSLLKYFRWEHAKVHTVPLDDFDFSPNIIKIDVEGHEVQALQGLQNTIAKHRPYLMVECSPESFPAVDRLLSRHGLIAASYHAAEDVFKVIGDDFVVDTSLVEQRNIFYFPREKLNQFPIEPDHPKLH